MSGSSGEKDVDEEIGEYAQRDEPDTDEQQDAPTPAFDGRGCGRHRFYCALLGGTNGEGQRKHEKHDHQRGDPEGEQGGSDPSDDQRLPGQTGQDRTRSTKAGGQVAESEEGETQERALLVDPALLTLATEEGSRGRLEAAKRDVQAAELDEGNEDQEGSNADPQDTPDRAGESHVPDQGIATESDDGTEQRQKEDNAERESSSEDQRVRGRVSSAFVLGSPLGDRSSEHCNQQRERARREERGDACSSGQNQQAGSYPRGLIEAWVDHEADVAHEGQSDDANRQQCITNRRNQ